MPCGRESRVYLGKDISPAEFETALHKIRFGRRYISENIVRELARVAYGDLSDNPFQQLSVREMQIMLMVLGCKSPSSIAQVLHLSAKTVNKLPIPTVRKVRSQKRC
jgi:two-component system invasion response regulator UvrY